MEADDEIACPTDTSFPLLIKNAIDNMLLFLPHNVNDSETEPHKIIKKAERKRRQIIEKHESNSINFGEDSNNSITTSVSVDLNTSNNDIQSNGMSDDTDASELTTPIILHESENNTTENAFTSLPINTPDIKENEIPDLEFDKRSTISDKDSDFGHVTIVNSTINIFILNNSTNTDTSSQTKPMSVTDTPDQSGESHIFICKRYV